MSGVEGNTKMYVVCDRLLDPETNEHCEFDGWVRVEHSGNWTCPACGRTNYFDWTRS